MPKQDGSHDSSPASVGDALPFLDAPLQIDLPALLERLAEVPDEANGLLKLLDGRRTLREALAASEDAAQAAAAAKALWALGVVRPVPGAGAAEGAARALAEDTAGEAAAPAGAEPPPAPLRIVRFPARRKRVPPPPGRRGGLADPGATPGGEARGGQDDRAEAQRSRSAGGSERGRPRAGGDGATTSAWGGHRIAAALLIAGAVVATVLFAVIYLR